MLFCPDCGYDLQGITSERCPECGIVIDREALARSQIPWSHRRQIGWWRAYWRTLKLVIFKSRILASEVARPVSYRDAQLFRLVTILLAIAPVLVVIAVWWMTAEDRDRAGVADDWMSLIWHPASSWYPAEEVGGWIILLAMLGAIGALLTLTGVQSYFFHPRSLPVIWQNRAVALSYYTCAPVAPLGMAMAFCLAVILTQQKLSYYTAIRYGPIIDLLRLGSLGIAGLMAFALFFVNVRLLQRTTRCGMIPPIGMSIMLLILPPIIVAIALALPIIFNFVKLVVRH